MNVSIHAGQDRCPINLLGDIERTLDTISKGNYFRKDVNKCPQECQSSQFNVQVTFGDRIENRTSLKFVLAELSSLELTQIPKMNEFSLISSIGGSLGLFIGVRFLSFVEVVEFCY